MNEQYTIGDLGDLINYRLQRAQETLDEADYNAAVNRLYYACYYAASALMVANHLEASSHKGIKSMLGLKFIKTGRLDYKYGRIYH